MRLKTGECVSQPDANGAYVDLLAGGVGGVRRRQLTVTATFQCATGSSVLKVPSAQRDSERLP